MPGSLWLPSLLVALVAPSEERRHRPGPEPHWAESWDFDFAAADGSLGGFARLALYPNLGVAWYWAAVVGRGRRLVLVKDHELEPPRGRDLEIRGPGIWSAVNCETPLDHWSVGLEAFAVAFDDPTEAWRSERGDLVGLGFDLEWEAAAPATRIEPGDGYRQPCRVSGEILVGEEQLAFDDGGWREHRWGVEQLGAPRPAAATVAAAPLLISGADGRRIRVMRALVADVDGYRWAQWVDEFAGEA